MKTLEQPDDFFSAPFEDPYKNLAYSVIKRSMLDALGKELNLDSYMRSGNQRNKVINKARKWIHEESTDSLGFETMCFALNIEPDNIRRRIPKDFLPIEKPKVRVNKMKPLGKRLAHYQRIKENILQPLSIGVKQ